MDCGKSGGSRSTLLRWLESLEKEFDKAFVDLDLILGEIDVDQMELTFEGRLKMTALSASFAQLVHKSQAIFQSNLRLEEELNKLRKDYMETQALKTVLENEVRQLMLQVHALQCDIYSKTAPHDSEIIKKKLEQDIDTFHREILGPAQLKAGVNYLTAENERLRKLIEVLQSEVYGARLAAKYLDKELAGRIQQIQLLNREMRGPEHDHLWNQLESEIHLHRHKTVIKACRGRAKSKCIISENGSAPTRSNKDPPVPRTVVLQKNPKEGLGLAITGGKEHGVPILISEIYHDQAAYRCGQLFVGDTILSVNGIDLRQANHAQAVEVLSKQTGCIKMEVIFLNPEQDSDDEADIICTDDDGLEFNIYENVSSSSATAINGFLQNTRGATANGLDATSKTSVPSNTSVQALVPRYASDGFVYRPSEVVMYRNKLNRRHGEERKGSAKQQLAKLLWHAPVPAVPSSPVHVPGAAFRSRAHAAAAECPSKQVYVVRSLVDVHQPFS